MTLPKAYDFDDEDTITVSVKLDEEQKSWINYNSNDREIVAKPTDSTAVGLKRITIELDDSYDKTEYILLMNVIKAAESPKPVPVPEPETKPEPKPVPEEEKVEEEKVEEEKEDTKEEPAVPEQSEEKAKDEKKDDRAGFETVNQVVEEKPKEPEPEPVEEYYDEDEDPGKPPTIKTNFDASTLWAIQKRKEKMKAL